MTLNDVSETNRRTAINRAELQIIDGNRQPGADGMPVARPFASRAIEGFDPFINFVHFGPRPINETNWGFPAHPHKGFETITYMLDGQLEHHDSEGGHAILYPGDVQWMTAGRGIQHSELPPNDFQQSDGVVHGFQIWLNLKATDKLAEPGFRMVRGKDMPVRHPAEGVELRVIAETDGPTTMLTPIEFIHARLTPNVPWLCPITSGHRALVYVVSGGVEVAISENPNSAIRPTTLHAGQMAEVVGGPEHEVTSLTLTGTAANGDDSAPADLLYFSGQPLDEPVVGYGPFVMNTAEEIKEAIQEFRDGRMGTVGA
jgi:redox-sensitive bicupin YhaK (pirin superfamily)